MQTCQFSALICLKDKIFVGYECSILKRRSHNMVVILSFFCLQTLCKKDLTFCTSHAQGIKAKADCYIEYGKCLKNGGPTPVTYSPSHHAMDDSSSGQFTVRSHTWAFCEWDEKFKYFASSLLYKVVNYVEEGVFSALSRAWEIGKKFPSDVCYLKTTFATHMYIV